MSDLRRVCLPYCLQKQPDGRYVLLNRDYKPLGFATSGRVDYAQYPIAHALKLTRKAVEAISVNGVVKEDAIYLYDDGCIPTDSAAHMARYLEKIAVLAKVQLERGTSDD